MSGIGLSEVVVIVVIVVIVGALLLARRGAVRRPAGGQRHPAVRILCAALALGAVAWTGYASVQEAGRPYAAAAAQEQLIRLPAQAAPAWPVAAEPNEEPQRLLLHMVLVEDFQGGHIAIAAEAHEVVLPPSEERGRPQRIEKAVQLEGRFEHGDGVATYTIRRVVLHHAAFVGADIEHRTLELDRQVGWRAPQSSRSSGGSHWIDGAGHGVTLLQRPRPQPAAPGAIGPRRTDGHLRLVTLVTPVALDDPLRAGAVAELTQRIDAALASDPIYDPWSGLPARRPPPGVAALEHLGLTALLLVVAAALLAQVFRRRGLALAGALALLMLYAVAVERWALEAHLDRLADSDAPVALRHTAAAHAAGAFFHAGPALCALEALAADDLEPEALTLHAAALAEQVRARVAPSSRRAAEAAPD